MFRKDEYIITLELDSYTDVCAKENYCFKVEREDDYLTMYVDLEGISNGHSVLTFDKSRRLKDWRYATPEEIEEYERLGKPYDVTTLNQFVLPKKWWLKITTNEQDTVLTDYCNQKFSTQTGPIGSRLTQPIFYYSEKIGHLCWTVGENRADESFTEITYSQFLKYVLNQPEVADNYSYLIPMIEKLNN